MKSMRTYPTGSTRSNADGKIEYLGFTHPLVEKSFGEYMMKHRVQEDGKLRASNNWWKGIDQNDTIQSLIRHVKDLEAIHIGYDVYKIRNKDGEKTIYSKLGSIFNINKGDVCNKITIDDCLNAIKFNCNSYYLELLKTRKIV